MSRKAFLRNLFSLSLCQWYFSANEGNEVSRTGPENLLKGLMTYLISGKKGKNGDFQWSAVQSERVSGALNLNAPGGPWLQAHLIAPEPDSTWTWLHLITPHCNWLYLITPGSTWLHLVLPDCTWAWLHLIGSSTGFTWLKCTCLLALEQYLLNLTAFDSTSSRVHCIFVCFGSKNSMAQNGISLQL